MSERPATTPEPVRSGAHAARWWRAQPGGRVECTLCPRRCRLRPGQSGFCAVRSCDDGALVSRVYGRPTAVAVDPIEKKPLYHFLPGSQILSIGTVGCNLACKFCQNWHLSRARTARVGREQIDLPPAAVPGLARREGCRSVAFTYNEPTIFGEYVLDTARACREAGVATVTVTNGTIEREALDEIYPWIDAANVDLKSFSDEFYRRLTRSRLAPVLAAIVRMRELGTWLELTTLLIPGLNDADEELERECAWILEHLGPDVPLHFSGFHPDHQLLDRPPTPPATLRRARELALARGVRHVYCGNVRDEETHATRCPGCGATLVTRAWHTLVDNRLARTDACGCGLRIAGRFGAHA